MLRWCLAAWWRQTITWTTVDKSTMTSCGIDLRTFSQEILTVSLISWYGNEITNLRLQLHLPGAIEWTHDDIFKWKHFPCNWPFVWGIHRSSVNIPSQRPVTRSFDVFFDLRLNKELSKQSRVQWFETPSCSLWRHCNVFGCQGCTLSLELR